MKIIVFLAGLVGIIYAAANPFNSQTGEKVFRTFKQRAVFALVSIVVLYIPITLWIIEYKKESAIPPSIPGNQEPYYTREDSVGRCKGCDREYRYGDPGIEDGYHWVCKPNKRTGKSLVDRLSGN